MSREEFAPIAEIEIERCEMVLDMVDNKGVLPNRIIPDWDGPSATYAPYKTTIKDSSATSHWLCNGYCNHRAICQVLPQGENVSVEIARKVATEQFGATINKENENG